MLAKIIWWDHDDGLGVVRTVEGQEFHISADMAQSMEQDSQDPAMFAPGLIVRINPDATKDGSMVLGVEKASKDDAEEYSRQEKARKDQIVPESKKWCSNLKEDLDSEKQKVIYDLVAEFGEQHKAEIEETLDLSKGRYSDMGDAGSFKVDGTEYNLIHDEDEAERIATELTENDLDNEPEIFSQDFLKDHIYIDDVTKREIALDDADSRRKDLEYDLEREDFENVFATADKYKDEYEALQEKLDDTGDKDEEKKIKDEILALGKKSIEEWEEEEIDRMESELKDPIQYFVHDMGAYTVEELMKQPFIQIDTKAAAEEAVRIDSWSHFISLYDGNYESTQNGYIYFRED